MYATLNRTGEQFVTLGIDREIFAVPVERVLEILDHRPMFRVPDAPPCLAGLIDVRSRSVPVIDLRVKLGLPELPPGPTTRILVLQVRVAGRELVLGLVADRVIEVTPLDGGRMEPPPDIGMRWRAGHISGVGRRGEAFVLVFDLEQLFASNDASFLAADEGNFAGRAAA